MLELTGCMQSLASSDGCQSKVSSVPSQGQGSSYQVSANPVKLKTVCLVNCEWL